MNANRLGQRPNSHQPQNPLEIGEIRNMVYQKLFRAIPNDGALNVTFLHLDTTNNDALKECTLDKLPYTFHKLDVVPMSGRAKAFGMSLARVPAAFNEFLSLNAGEMMFAFTTVASLRNFSEMFHAYVKAGPAQQAEIQVAVWLFHSATEFGSMKAWKEIDMAHGYQENAHLHVKEWVEAVQTLPPYARVSLVLRYPWRDYRSLRGVTRPLREQDVGAGRRRLKGVAVQMDAWDEIPDDYFHLSMTVASVEGREMAEQSQVTEQKAEQLVKYGNRGFGRIG